jgi:tetratricopeptide (TPR) repeat protein
VKPVPGRAAALGAALVATLACTSPLTEGERAYREGDRLAALETWRSIPVDDSRYGQAQERIGQVEREFHQLVLRYKQRGRYFESRERLAESILNYRLALKLQPDDHETLGHVQALSRVLAERRRETLADFQTSLEALELASARTSLSKLRELDPFDPELEIEARQFEQVLEDEVDRQMEAGRTGFTTGDLNRAGKAFRRVLELDPANESAQGYLSYVEAIRAAGGAYKPGSLELLALPGSQDEIRAEGFHRNAVAAERAGDPYAAIRYELSALEAYPEHTAARHNLARIRQGLAPEVDELIESGRVHYLQEDLESALDQWRKVLLIDPGNERAVEYVERANRLMENLERLRSDPR